MTKNRPGSPGDFRFGDRLFLIVSGVYRRRVRRFMRRLFRTLLGLGHGSGDVSIGHLQVVILCDCSAVAEPGAHDVAGILLCQLRLSRGSQVVEQLRPGRHACTLDDPVLLRPQVCLAVAAAGNDVLGAFVGLLEC